MALHPGFELDNGEIIHSSTGEPFVAGAACECDGETLCQFSDCIELFTAEYNRNRPVSISQYLEMAHS